MISSTISKLLLLICLSSCGCRCSPQCLDENGDAVDWYVLYKLPRIKNSTDAKLAQGIDYTYITSKTVKQGWRYSASNITDPNSIPGRTLAAVYPSERSNDVNDIFYLMYNDQPPNKTYTVIQGHTKGALLGDQDGGIWLVHSVPHFPIMDSDSYQYPSTGHTYGQSFLCVNVAKEDLHAIGTQLMVNWANTYSYKFEGALASSYPTLLKAAQMERDATVQNKIQFSSLGNEQFTSFAKSSKFGKDLYCKWVAGTLRADLYVESWLHEHTLPTDCSDPFQVHNVEQVAIDKSRCTFSSWKDHSKFAVSGQSDNPWVCIGDINRATEQFIRGGGTVCLRNFDLWSAYHSIVAAFEPCPKTRALSDRQV